MHIKTVNLGKTFLGSREVLRDVNLSIDQGEIVGLIGPSGCGKSTLLRVIAGLEAADRGEVSTNGDVSFVFQDALLLDWRTALENAALPLEIKRIAPLEREERCRKILEKVGLSGHMLDYPDQLSGGMQMRVSLARALATDPSILLLDEPFAALDEMTREKLNLEVLRLKKERGISALFVTHNIFEAVFMCDRILIMNQIPASIAAEVKISLSDRSPAVKGTPEYAELVGEVQQAMREL